MLIDSGKNYIQFSVYQKKIAKKIVIKQHMLTYTKEKPIDVKFAKSTFF